MDRVFRGVAAGLVAMFVLLAWAILAIPAGLVVKLIMFFALTASAFGITLVMTTESPVADAVLKAPWADDENQALEDHPVGEGEEEPAEAARASRAREGAAARGAGGRRARVEATAAVAAKHGQGGEPQED